jgi:DNA topoisomerase-1
LVVESPNKVGKLQGFLDELYGAGAWRVVATVGHWRGLPPMKGQAFSEVVDTSSFEERFVIHNADVASRLRSAISKASTVFLATDPDREGEAIAWHVVDELHPRDVKRVLFREITKPALKQAIDNAASIDTRLVEAQRARQVLDYEMGMEVSRRLWRFGARSAGRVQSAALRIVVDRETAIRDFQSTDYWTVAATYKEAFVASVATFDAPTEIELDEAGEGADPTPKLRPKRFTSKEEADNIVQEGKRTEHVVESVDENPTTLRPKPPYETSTLLADASSVLGWRSDKTTKLAQSLFEEGLITYIRTDSVALSQEAITAVRGYLREHHPAELPATPQKYADKSGAQGAHEAIRPTDITNTKPAGLDEDLQALYDLIWRRTLVSQAASAELTKTVVTIRPIGCAWRLLATGSVVNKRGFLALETPDTRSAQDALDRGTLPALIAGQQLSLQSLLATGSKTKPPPRFTERSLVAYLKRKGIGRPSTYASIIATLYEREYVAEIKKRLIPEELGLLADRLTRHSFDALTQEEFTAVTEESLDKIAEGKLDRPAFLARFHSGLVAMLNSSTAALEEYARRHPELDRDAAVKHEAPCPTCKGPMLRRRGKFGAYAQCTDASCARRVSLEPLKELALPCPECSGVVVEQPYVKEGKRQKFFRCKTCAWKSSTPPPKPSKWPCHVDPTHGLMLEVSYTKDKKKNAFFQKLRSQGVDRPGPSKLSCL